MHYVSMRNVLPLEILYPQVCCGQEAEEQEKIDIELFLLDEVNKTALLSRVVLQIHVIVPQHHKDDEGRRQHHYDDDHHHNVVIRNKDGRFGCFVFHVLLYFGKGTLIYPKTTVALVGSLLHCYGNSCCIPWTATVRRGKSEEGRVKREE